MNLIRGVLLAGKFRSQHDLNGMSHDDQRNTLIVELAGRTNQPGQHFQSLNDDALAGAGVVLVYLRTAGIRTDQQLKAMSDDDQRNILIVEIGGQLSMGSELQGLSNMELVLLGLGKPLPGGLQQGSFIRGVLLAGKFRTQHELNKMSQDDQRNTLIVELAAHSNQTNLQSFNDFDLAGMGAVMVFLRETKIRSDKELKAMSADDQRNTLIVEIGFQTKLGAKLQGLRNMDLVLAGLGVDPEFKPLPPPLQPLPPLPFVFGIDSVEIRRQKADGDHSDSDWLTIVVSIANPVTKSIRTLPAKIHHIEGNIKTGDVIRGAFVTDPFMAEDSEIVIINYVLANLGSSDAENQFAQAVKITDKVVAIAGPVVGAAVALFFFGKPPGEGFQIGEQIAQGFDTAIDALSDVFDFLDIHIGPPNCNGEVLHDTLTFQPGELAKAVNRPASRDYTGPQENERCGGAPESRVNFSVHQVSAG